MPASLDLTHHDLLALSRSTLAALRTALLRDNGPAAAGYLQEAGYAGGETVYASFREWLRKFGRASPEDLEIEEFQRKASAYFREAGWGTLEIGSLRDTVATVDSADWGEADPAAQLDSPGCHLTTGMFADFFGRLSESPLAVLEVECRSMGSSRCRFLLGNAETMQTIFAAMDNGSSYEEAVAQVGGGV